MFFTLLFRYTDQRECVVTELDRYRNEDLVR